MDSVRCRCVELDPKNLQAYISLASSYANELLTNEALDSLRSWLANNEKYSHLLSNRRSQATSNAEPRLIDEYVLCSCPLNCDRASPFSFRLLFEDLQELFLQAVSLSNNPSEIDADLQVRTTRVKWQSNESCFRFASVYCFICLAIMTKQQNASIQPY